MAIKHRPNQPNRSYASWPKRYATLKKHNGQKRTDHLKSENVKVETEIKEKVNRVMKIERVGKNYYLGEI